MNARRLWNLAGVGALVVAIWAPWSASGDTNRQTQASATNAAQTAASPVTTGSLPGGNASTGQISETISAQDLKKLEGRAEAGEAAAQFELGLRHATGQGAAKNGAEAVRWFCKAAEQGVAEAKTRAEGVVNDLQQAAEKGDPQAQVDLGMCYEVVEEDDAEAVKWYRKAAEQGFAKGQERLGSLYSIGFGVPKDLAEAIKWLRKAGEQGNVDAQRTLGECYSSGVSDYLWQGVEPNAAEAAKWYRKAADHGDDSAQCKIANMYANGEGLPKNLTEAAEWYRKAAEQGSSTAQLRLGYCYSRGEGVAKDAAEAVKWYRKAADQDDGQAQFELGTCYRKGEGITENLSEAVQWYRKAAEQHDGMYLVLSGRAESSAVLACLRNAAEQGSADGQYALGLAVSSKLVMRNKTDAAEGIKWFRKAAEQGTAAAQFKLAACYLDGEGVAKDSAEAVKWYRKAAEQGHRDSQYKLGQIHELGSDSHQDYAEAATWYRKAADAGDPEAQYDIGRCYFYGKGVTEDGSEAVKWWRKAANQREVKAQIALGQAFQKGEIRIGDRTLYRGITKNPEESTKWYRKAAEWKRIEAEGGDQEAQDYLAKAYETGQGVPKDLRESAKWYRKEAEPWQKAAGQGDANAMLSLASFYREGKGFQKDEAKALSLCRMAAEQGHSGAQSFLGMAYGTGIWGAPKDFVQSYTWFNVAAARGKSEDGTWRDEVAREMTPEQIAEAQRRSAAFIPKKKSWNGNESGQPGEMESDATPKASGTGFFVTADGYLLTSYHVVEEAARISVRAGGKSYTAKLVKADKANDVALLKVSGSFRALPIGASRGVKLGESVFTVGFPNTEIQGVEPKLTRGEINSLNGAQDDPRAFQISAAVQPGNSGGPLVNQYGNVVGIVESRLSDIATLKATGSLPQNVNYAVKSSVLNVLLESLPEVSVKLKEPYPAKERKFEAVVKEAQESTALVLVY